MSVRLLCLMCAVQVAASVTCWYPFQMSPSGCVCLAVGDLVTSPRRGLGLSWAVASQQLRAQVMIVTLLQSNMSLTEMAPSLQRIQRYRLHKCLVFGPRAKQERWRVKVSYKTYWSWKKLIAYPFALLLCLLCCFSCSCSISERRWWTNITRRRLLR